jgi:hypothetical protein
MGCPPRCTAPPQVSQTTWASRSVGVCPVYGPDPARGVPDLGGPVSVQETVAGDVAQPELTFVGWEQFVALHGDQ